MTQTKSPLLQQGAATNKHNESIPAKRRPVNALAKLRADKNIPGEVIVTTVKKMYPKFSKSLLSMCEHTSAYGVELAQPAMIALTAAYSPETSKKRPMKERRKLSYRIYGRLSESDAREFEQAKKADGYATTQDWVQVAVRKYLAERRL